MSDEKLPTADEVRGILSKPADLEPTPEQVREAWRLANWWTIAATDHTINYDRANLSARLALAFAAVAEAGAAILANRNYVP